MTERRLALTELVELLEGDRDFLDQLFALGLLERSDTGFLPEQAEEARVARTLITELEVNWAGVEIILRMRAEMLDMRRQLAELVEMLRR